MNDLIVGVGTTAYTYTLKRLSGKELYRYQRDDGEWVSPIYTSVQSALSREQWKLTDHEWRLRPKPDGEVETVNDIGFWNELSKPVTRQTWND